MGLHPAELWIPTATQWGVDGAILRNADLPRFQALAAHPSYVLAALCALLILACSATATPSPPLPAEQTTRATTPTSTPAQAGRASSTQTDPPTVSLQQSAGVDRVFIQLTDPLDEPEYYCLDVPGAGPSVSLQSALQVHTCKARATAADELFTVGHPEEGQIYVEAYDLCVEAEGPEEGSSLRLQTCTDSPHQLFAFEDDLIRLSGGGQERLCLAAASGLGIPTGGPSHLRRALTLEGCETTDPTLTGWSVGLSVPTGVPLSSLTQTQITQTPLPAVTATLAPTPSSSLYTNELWNYTIAFPSSWVVVASDPSSVIIGKILEDDSLLFVAIEVESVQPDLTTREYADIKIAEGARPEVFKSYNLDSLTKVTVAGVGAWKATETFRRVTDDKSRKGEEYFFVVNGVGYGIYAESYASQWSSMEPIFNETIQSLTLN